jgi:hypothetical protein
MKLTVLGNPQDIYHLNNYQIKNYFGMDRELLILSEFYQVLYIKIVIILKKIYKLIF